MIEVKVSSKWARHLFACTPDFIKSTCHGRCCQGTGRIVVSLLPDEAEREIAKGRTVIQGLLQPDDRGLCPNKQLDGFCSVHGTPEKPLGCVASPFTLAGKTLIVRYRYARLKCGGHGEPAYKVFRSSLVRIFGAHEAGAIAWRLDRGHDDITAEMAVDMFDALHALDDTKKEGA